VSGPKVIGHEWLIQFLSLRLERREDSFAARVRDADVTIHNKWLGAMGEHVSSIRETMKSEVPGLTGLKLGICFASRLAVKGLRPNLLECRLEPSLPATNFFVVDVRSKRWKSGAGLNLSPN
jgi:hypothetical protein